MRVQSRIISTLIMVLAIAVSGVGLAQVRAMAPAEISLSEIYRSIWPFALVMLLTLVLVIFFPQLALWLPGKIY